MGSYNDRVPKTINLNDVAQKVTIAEGGVISQSIAQVKEVMRLTLSELASYSNDDLNALFDAVRKAKEYSLIVNPDKPATEV